MSLPHCVHAIERFWFARAFSRRASGVAEKDQWVSGLYFFLEGRRSRSLPPVGFVRALAESRPARHPRLTRLPGEARRCATIRLPSRTMETTISHEFELHGLFQFVGRSKRDLLARLDLDCFACRGIASHPGRPFADLEDAKAGQADFVALLQMARSEGHQIAKYRFSLLFR